MMTPVKVYIFCQLQLCEVREAPLTQSNQRQLTGSDRLHTPGYNERKLAHRLPFAHPPRPSSFSGREREGERVLGDGPPHCASKRRARSLRVWNKKPVNLCMTMYLKLETGGKFREKKLKL